jgi:hypothetical protein
MRLHLIPPAQRLNETAAGVFAPAAVSFKHLSRGRFRSAPAFFALFLVSILQRTAGRSVPK